jgi:PleD family two-component response regulator
MIPVTLWYYQSKRDTMNKIHILIVDESRDLAKSLGNLILDVFGIRTTSVEYAFNVQDGLKMSNQAPFHFIFIRVNMASGNAVETKSLFKEISLNPSVKIITLSFNRKSGHRENNVEIERRRYPFNEDVDVDDLAFIFEKMK